MSDKKLEHMKKIKWKVEQIKDCEKKEKEKKCRNKYKIYMYLDP